MQSQTFVLSANGIESKILSASSKDLKSETLTLSANDFQSQTLPLSANGVESKTLIVSAKGLKSETLTLSANGFQSQTLSFSAKGVESKTLIVSAKDLKSETLTLSANGFQSQTLSFSAKGVNSKAFAFSENYLKSKVFSFSEIEATVFEKPSNRFIHSLIGISSILVNSQELGLSHEVGISLSFGCSTLFDGTQSFALSAQFRGSNDLFDSDCFPLSERISLSLVLVSDTLKSSIYLSASSSLIVTFVILSSQEMIDSLSLINSLTHEQASFSVVVSSHFSTSESIVTKLFKTSPLHLESNDAAHSSQIAISDTFEQSRQLQKSMGIENSNSAHGSAWLLSIISLESFADLSGSSSLISEVKLKISEIQEFISTSSPIGGTTAGSGNIIWIIVGSSGAVLVLLILLFMYCRRLSRQVVGSGEWGEQEMSPEIISEYFDPVAGVSTNVESDGELDLSFGDVRQADVFQLNFEENPSKNLFM
jgi:hypothetical protein